MHWNRSKWCQNHEGSTRNPPSAEGRGPESSKCREEALDIWMGWYLGMWTSSGIGWLSRKTRIGMRSITNGNQHRTRKRSSTKIPVSAEELGMRSSQVINTTTFTSPPIWVPTWNLDEFAPLPSLVLSWWFFWCCQHRKAKSVEKDQLLRVGECG
jgi:hypothetical protein